MIAIFRIDVYKRQSYDRNCLLVYITSPFIKVPKKETHQNQWQVVELAKIISQFQYNVDVIDFDNSKVKLSKEYDLIIDIDPGGNLSLIHIWVGSVGQRLCDRALPTFDISV